MKFNRLKSTCLLLTTASLSLTSFGAQATFRPADADEIDREYYDTEFLFDIYTYRYSLGLENLWNAHDVAYRTSFGSLDGHHFYRAEDIKIATRVDAMKLEYIQTKREDFVEKRNDAIFKASYFTSDEVAVAFLASSDFYKKWADAGVALDLYEGSKKSFSLQVFSIDPFYNIKEIKKTDKYKSAVWNISVEKSFFGEGSNYLKIGSEIDSPLVWKRRSEGYTYNYRQEAARADGRYKFLPQWNVLGNSTFERKVESKSFQIEEKNSRSDDQRDQSLSLERYVGESELELRQQVTGSNTVHSYGARYVIRDADYDRTESSAAVQAAPASALRDAKSGQIQEYSISQMNDLPFAQGSSHYARFGGSTTLILQSTGNDEIQKKTRVEAKVHTGWEYRLSDKGVIGLHISWDADNWVRKITQNKDYAASWDGGNFQLALAL